MRTNAGLSCLMGVAASIVMSVSLSAWGQASQPVSQPASRSAVSPAAAAAAGAAAPVADDEFEAWVKKCKKPVPWLEWGADERARWEYRNNAVTLDKKVANHEFDYQRARTRLWTTITPVKDIEVNARAMWEFRNFILPKTSTDTDLDEVVMDILNIKAKNIFNLPLTATVGRQEIVLGDGWLVAEGTPIDGSRTAYFDAARVAYEFKPAKTTVDVSYIQQYAAEDQILTPFNHREIPRGYVTEQDERGGIVWVTNKSLAKTEVNGYFIYKHDDKALATGDQGDIYTFGARVYGAPDDNWKYRAEIAPQFGHKNAQELSALGFNSRVSYDFNDALKNQVRGSYEFLSGDDPDTKGRNESFDILWGRYPQNNEVLGYTFGPTMEGRRAFDWTNLHRVGPGWAIYPMPKLQYCIDYYLMFADETTFRENPRFSENGFFRGNLVTTKLEYIFNPHLKTSGLAEFFFPGNYYSDRSNDPSIFLRWEIVLSW